jgi:hypothetical protein
MHASEQGDFITARLLLDALNRGGRAPPRWEQAAAMTKCSGCAEVRVLAAARARAAAAPRERAEAA